MEESSATKEILWEEQQRAVRAQAVLDRRESRKNFVLVLGLIVVTVAVVMILAAMSGGSAVRC